MLISAIIPSRNRNACLASLVTRLAGQTLPAPVSLEVIAALDGCHADEELQAAVRQSPHPVRLLELEHVGISGAKNAAVAAAMGDLLLFLNDDILPEPGFVAEHARAQQEGGHREAVLGYTGWTRPDKPAVMDWLIAGTPMIFFYGTMTDGQTYNFRHAWNLNLSIPRKLFDEAGGFAEKFRPCMYEDIELAWRLARIGCAVRYHTAASAVHNHRYTWESYLRREIMLGLMAPELSEVNPRCFAEIFRQDLGELAEAARSALEIDRKDDRRIYDWLANALPSPSNGSMDKQHLEALYNLHLPVKRRAFRHGLLAAVNAGASDWRNREAATASALMPECLFT